VAHKILLLGLSVYARTSDLNRAIKVEGPTLRHYDAAFGSGFRIVELPAAEGNSVEFDPEEKTLKNISRIFSLAREKFESSSKGGSFELSLKKLFSYFFELGGFGNCLELAVIRLDIMKAFVKESSALLFLYSPHLEAPAEHKENLASQRSRLNILISSLQKLVQGTDEISLKGQLLLVGSILGFELNTKTFLELRVTPYLYSQILNEKLRNTLIQIGQNQPWQVLGLLSKYKACEVI